MASKIIFALIITIVVMLDLALSQKLPQAECQKQDDCQEGSCCLLMPTRYSYPSCRPQGKEGEMCRPGAETRNLTLSYPDGSQLEVTDVNYILCSCAPGLTCDPTEGKCKAN